MDPHQLEQAFDFTQRCTQNGGLLVVRHGYLVFEKYFGRAHRNANPDMASTGKAFTSIACGIMLHEFHDKIPDGLDTKVFTEKYLPEAFPLDDPRKADITLGQLLCMTAGYNGEGQAPIGVVHGQGDAAEAGAGAEHPRPGHVLAPRAALDRPGRGLLVLVARRRTSPRSCCGTSPAWSCRTTSASGWPSRWAGAPWGYCLHRGDFDMPHANGAGSIAVHATDALRFGYCLLHEGKWGDKQLVPADYVALCNKPSPYNPHCPFSLQFEHNSDGHVAGAPRDAFYKSGAGGFGIFVVPSLDLVIYKLGGKDNQYDPALTGLPQPFQYDGSRDNWQPIPRTPFNEGSLGGDDGLRRVLEMVSAAVRD